MKSLAPTLAVLVGVVSAVAANAAAAALERAAPLRSGNPAVLALLETAQQELGAGRPQQASTFLERALQLEPRNPTVWHYLGVARLDLGNFEQAEAMAAKSHSLAGNDRALRVSNAELLATALQSSGRTPTDAEREVLAAPSTFDLGVERARRYVGTFGDTRGDARVDTRERRDDSEPPRSRSPAAVAQGWRDARSFAAQRAQAAARRAEAAAQRAEAAAQRAEEELYRRSYRYESNEPARRRQR